jgi:TonB-dependent starch-binding outer membrane protein SusC
MKNLFKLCFTFAFLMALTTAGYAQRTVSGVITDAETNEPLIGATVLAKGTQAGTVTDISGNYSLRMPEGSNTIVVSYTGYTTQEIEVIGDVLNVALGSGSILDEVVVVGYGSLKSKEVTSSVVSVKSEDFNVGNITSPAQLLQGKVAGLTIVRDGGDPNGRVGIRLRGLSTIGAQTEPLVIVDGVPGGSLSNIDPADIETIDVLKDGSAAAIYGTRGSSGVIIINTRKGKKGEAKVNYGAFISTESISKTPDIASISEYRAAGGNDVGGNTDWYDEISQTGFAQAHNISVSGGTENTSYRASFNYRQQDGVVKNTGFDQRNFGLSVNQRALNNKLNVGLNFIYTDKDVEIGFKEAFRYATILNPTSEVFNEDGTYNHPGGFDFFNPVEMVELNVSEGNLGELLGNMTANYEIVKGLSVTGSYAKQRKNTFVGEYYPSNAWYRGGVARNGVALRADISEDNDLYEGYFQYQGEAGNISFNLLAGTSYQKFNFGGSFLEAGGFLLDDNSYRQIDQAKEFRTGNARVGSFGDSYELQAQFGRAGINVDDTYFASVSVRREGSNRFGEDNRYGIFPAVSAGVDISKLANIASVDNLKLRVGYGITGNIPGQNNLFTSIFSPGAQFFFNGEFVPSYGPVTNANPDLKWETKAELNVGLDFALGGYKLTGSIDYFNRTTDDLILFTRVPVPPNLAPNTWDNVASFTTNGFELLLNYEVVKTDNFSYTPTFIFTTYKTILDEYLEDTPREFRTNLGAPGQNITDAGVGLHLLEEGKVIGQIVAPTFESVNPDGSIKFKDINGDEAIDANDWTVVGNGLPDFEMSLNNTFKFGRFDANVFFRGAFGHSLVNAYRAFYEFFPDNPSANFIKTSKANTAVKTASYNNTHVEKGDFVRLDNMSIGYTFNTENTKIGAVRVYVAGQNLFTITDYTGVDPEARLSDTGSVDNGGRDRSNLFGGNSGGDPLAPGVDRRNTYFFTRTVTLGANITF